MTEVYIIHFQKSYKNCRHYIGMTSIGTLERIKRHKKSTKGLLGAVNKENIEMFIYSLREFKNSKEAREYEIKLKSWKKSKQICPICRKEKIL